MDCNKVTNATDCVDYDDNDIATFVSAVCFHF